MSLTMKFTSKPVICYRFLSVKAGNLVKLLIDVWSLWTGGLSVFPSLLLAIVASGSGCRFRCPCMTLVLLLYFRTDLHILQVTVLVFPHTWSVSPCLLRQLTTSSTCCLFCSHHNCCSLVVCVSMWNRIIFSPHRPPHLRGLRKGATNWLVAPRVGGSEIS